MDDQPLTQVSISRIPVRGGFGVLVPDRDAADADLRERLIVHRSLLVSETCP